MNCIWIEHFDPDYWQTGCGNEFQIIDSTPKENGMVYCPFCGKKIKEEKEQ
jgi:hypothetical protein